MTVDLPEITSGKIVAGVDEVGRGPLAGPVLAAAVILAEPLEGLADSKKLSAARRSELAAKLVRDRRICIGLGAASVSEIDRLNILQASLLAMARAVQKLRIKPDLALIDGNRAPALSCPMETIVGGDAKVPAISAASIIAKVTRDRLMSRLDARYPGYGWQRNAGYPTAEHRAALNSLGLTRHHRTSFGPVKACLASGQPG
ncbi:MAG: ribonuclease HII [Geminicoccaceae bacterium]